MVKWSELKSADDMLAEMEAEQAARSLPRKAYDTVSRHVYRTYKAVTYTVPRELTWAWQRVFRGWDDRSLWSYDYWLCKTMAEQLEKFAADAHTYPGVEPYEESEVWAEILRYHARALRRYVTFAENGLLDLEPAEYKTEWEQVHTDLKRTLTWLGEWLPAIWD